MAHTYEHVKGTLEMPRELSKAEQQYIETNHDKMSAEEICADMPGVGVKTVEKFIETSILPEMKANETPEERSENLQKKTGLTAGKLMARDPDRGITAMTPGASELADVRRLANVPSTDKAARSQPERIHIINKGKKAR